MRGRKPLPAVIKKAKGTLRKHRINPREPKPQEFLGEPPEHLSDGAKEAWRYAIRFAPPGLLTTLDGSILMIWACAADLYNKAQQGLAKTGLLIKLPEGGVPIQSPYLAIANKQAQIMAKAATEMGFTPATRSRVSVAAEAPDELDPWDEIAG
jgi:P27 family predicted phage terminase small subunit